MRAIDWAVLVATVLAIVSWGVWKTRRVSTADDYLRGGGERFWTVGLSIMATQASAITFLSMPGQAYEDGLGFLQFYFGLPVAMYGGQFTAQTPEQALLSFLSFVNM